MRKVRVSEAQIAALVEQTITTTRQAVAKMRRAGIPLTRPAIEAMSQSIASALLEIHLQNHSDDELH